MKKEQKLAILDRLEEMYPDAKAELVFSNPYDEVAQEQPLGR